MNSSPSPEIRIVCEKCDKYMDLYQSLNSAYYRCRRFPRCKITGNPEKVSEAIQNKLVTELISLDKIKIYRYDLIENVVFISEAKKTKGLVTKIEDGFWS